MIKLQARVLVRVFSCEFCEIVKNTFSKEHLRRMPASVQRLSNKCEKKQENAKHESFTRRCFT